MNKINLNQNKKQNRFYVENQKYFDEIVKGENVQINFDKLWNVFKNRTKYYYIHLISFIFSIFSFFVLITFVGIVVYFYSSPNQDFLKKTFSIGNNNILVLIFACIVIFFIIIYAIIHRFIYGFFYYLQIIFYKKIALKRNNKNEFRKNQIIAQFILIFSQNGIMVASAVKKIGTFKEKKYPPSYIAKACQVIKQAKKIQLV